MSKIFLLYFYYAYDANLWEKSFGRSTAYSWRTNVFTEFHNFTKKNTNSRRLKPNIFLNQWNLYFRKLSSAKKPATFWVQHHVIKRCNNPCGGFLVDSLLWKFPSSMEDRITWNGRTISFRIYGNWHSCTRYISRG